VPDWQDIKPKLIVKGAPRQRDLLFVALHCYPSLCDTALCCGNTIKATLTTCLPVSSPPQAFFNFQANASTHFIFRAIAKSPSMLNAT
jgi:hypothetical protein